jgi:hypothetical protein
MALCVAGSVCRGVGVPIIARAQIQAFDDTRHCGRVDSASTGSALFHISK